MLHMGTGIGDAGVEKPRGRARAATRIHTAHSPQQAADIHSTDTVCVVRCADLAGLFTVSARRRPQRQRVAVRFLAVRA
jgi:hypothetical protein